ncbi:MAG: polysaccharide pyruvyl transferase family protein [Lachnospiraceae bacterium]|nr:polysaccharide pyruvyl transferase family protein [Lachnospiraceae bacterium]
MKIGIVTYHRSHNYGAYLQSYSLSHALNSLEGVECEIINYNLVSEDTVYKKRLRKRPLYIPIYMKQDKMFEKLQEEQLLSGKLVLSNTYDDVLDEADSKYDIVIAGSDEIWRIASRGFPNIYWLPGEHNFRKLSYAASGRMKLSTVTDEKKELLGKLYADFEYIGVRDEATREMVEATCPGKKVYRNCDPAFLFNQFKPKETLKKYICEKWKLNPENKLIAVMYDRPDVISQLRKRLGREYKFICITRPMWNADKNLCAVTPFEWVDIIGGCDYLVSSYFHGMLFAVNQNTPFVTIDRRANRSNLNTSKLYDFLSYTGMEERYHIASEVDDAEWKLIADTIAKEIEEGSTDFTEIVRSQRAGFEDFKNIIRGLVE